MIARLALVLVLAVAAVAAACAPTRGEACATNDDCPGADLICSAGTCMDAAAPAPLAGPAQFPLEPESTPRVIVRDDGGIDVLFAVKGCGGVARWRPLEGSQAVVALAGQCVREVDAKRGADGITHIVAGVPGAAGTEVLLVEIDDGGAVLAQASPSSSGAPRILPRVVLDGTGMFAAWADASSVEEVSDSATGLAAAPPAPLSGSVAGGLALLGATTVAYTDGQGLELHDGSSQRRLAGNVSGPVDAVSCGGDLTVAFRGVHDDKLLVANASSASAAYLADAFDDLPTGRAPGDVALSCDAGQLWIAHVVQGDGALRIASFDGTDWRPAAPDVDAEGAVSLAVVGGLYHAAFAGGDGLVRYAASR